MYASRVSLATAYDPLPLGPGIGLTPPADWSASNRWNAEMSRGGGPMGVHVFDSKPPGVASGRPDPSRPYSVPFPADFAQGPNPLSHALDDPIPFLVSAKFRRRQEDILRTLRLHDSSIFFQGSKGTWSPHALTSNLAGIAHHGSKVRFI